MQGDILAPAEELRSLFKEVHPHFCDDKYLAFVVTTQSCDLERRHGTCTARYINVAVVRSLSAVLFRLLDTVCERVLHEGFYSGAGRNRAHDLLERVFNQNEQKLGLFYLYPDGDIGIGEDAVAFLRVSVAFRADHYDLMCRARQGRLKPEFANKLGWLVGNLYSRVGTPDWPRKELSARIREHLKSHGQDGPVWLDERLAKEAKLRRDRGTAPEKSELLQMANEKVKSWREAGVDRIMTHVKAAVSSLSPAESKRLQATLMNDALLTSAFRR